jgi:hypothetical protein
VGNQIGFRLRSPGDLTTGGCSKTGVMDARKVSIRLDSIAPIRVAFAGDQTEFRAAVFNISTRSTCQSKWFRFQHGLGEITNTQSGSGERGPGYGEPFNVQFALKILF